MISTPSSILSVTALETALETLLSSNFDADSKVSLLTLLKIIDNIVSKPADDKVRTLKLSNNAIQQKIVSRKGALEFLLACGFHRRSDPPLLSIVAEERLVLENENTQHLLAARRLLHTRAVRDLHMDPNQLPPLKQPPTVNPSTSQFTSHNNTDFSFNPYAGHRFDAQAHAAGVPSVKPDANYKSPTETKLLQLQQQQQRLEHAARTQPLAREWLAIRPGQAIPLSHANDQQQSNRQSSDATALAKSSDSALIAQRLQQQQLAAQERERFTTKAMRQLKELERKRVYSHVTLTIQFNNGIRLIGKFLPSETIATVKETIMNECLVPAALSTTDVDGDVAMSDAPMPAQFDLFITPPRRTLDDSRTLDQEGLVPAAKIFCTATQDLHSHLFTVHDVDFPVGQAVAGPSSSSAGTEGTSSEEDRKEVKKKAVVSREEVLLQRMMGGSRTGPTGMGRQDADKNAPKKPKWFG